MINDNHTNTATITPRLALDPSCRFRWKVSTGDRDRISALSIGETCEITELEHGTRWIIRPAACSLTEPDRPSCYCDAQALPVEYPGGFSAIPNEDEAPAILQLEALRELLASPGLHPAFRLDLEEVEKHLEAAIAFENAVNRATLELEEVERRLDDRHLSATDRALLEQNRRELLAFLEANPLVLCECCPIGDDEDSPGDAIAWIVSAARMVANAERNADPERVVVEAAFEALLEAVEYACDYCLASALTELASSGD